MKVKELVEELLKLDQEKRIGVTVYDTYYAWVLEPKVELVSVNSNNKIVLEKEAVETVYEIVEK